jgi:hypothetical protein
LFKKFEKIKGSIEMKSVPLVRSCKN